jgi:predicted DNA-binding transcriptional regulator AlpA
LSAPHVETFSFLTKKQLAKLLSLTTRTVDRYVGQGLLPRGIQFGKRGPLRWRRSTIEQFLAKREQQK